MGSNIVQLSSTALIFVGTLLTIFATGMYFLEPKKYLSNLGLEFFADLLSLRMASMSR